MQRLLALAAEVHARAAERGVSEAPSGQPDHPANGDAGAASEQDNAPEETAAAPSGASNGRNAAPQGGSLVMNDTFEGQKFQHDHRLLAMLRDVL